MATEILRPNAPGDEASCDTQYPDSGEHWDKVDEASPDDNSTYIADKGSTARRDLYNLPAPSGSGAINFIKIYFRCKRDSVASNAEVYPSLKSNSTVKDGTPVSPTTSWVTYSEQWNTNPADGQAWEWDDISSLQIGFVLDANAAFSYAYCTQVYVEIDYTTVTEKTSSDAGSGVDAYVSLQTPQAKTSSDAGSGVEGTPLPGAALAGSESGSGIEALTLRLLAAFDAGYGVEASSVETDGLFKDLLANELGEGSDCLTAKIEMPTKGGGMKLWT